MLKRSKRIQGGQDVKTVLSKGKGITGSHFVLKKLENKKGRNRYAIVISKKIEKSAVKRNKKRRQAYEAFKKLDVPCEPHYDTVLLAKKSFMSLDFQKLIQYLKLQIK